MWFKDRAFRVVTGKCGIPVTNISQKNVQGILIIKYQSAA